MNRRDFIKAFAGAPLVLSIPVGVWGESRGDPSWPSTISRKGRLVGEVLNAKWNASFRIFPPRASESDPFAELGTAAWKARGDDGEMYGNLITLTDFDSAEIIAGEIARHFRSQISSIPALSHLEELSKEMIRDKILERLSV